MASTARPDDAAPAAATSASHFGVTDLMLLGMALIWGINFSVTKVGTRLLDPIAFTGVRVTLAAVCLLAIAASMRQRWPTRRDVLLLIGLGLLGNGFYQVFFIEGIARTRAGTAALVLAAGPAFVAIIGRMRGVERIDARGWLGIALQMGGMVCVVIGSAAGVTGEGDTLLGNTLILVGGILWALFTVLLKPLSARVHTLHLAAITMTAGSVLLLIIGAPAIAAASWSALPSRGWFAILYSGIGALVIAYLLWYRGLKVLGPTRTAMYINLQPLIALAFAWVTLHEVPTPWQGLGAASIMTGLILART
jgi:drug/metabolite transporter (DMT)-like permease